MEIYILETTSPSWMRIKFQRLQVFSKLEDAQKQMEEQFNQFDVSFNESINRSLLEMSSCFWNDEEDIVIMKIFRNTVI